MALELGLLATAREARFYRARLHWVRREFDEAESILHPLQTEAEAAGDGVVWMASTRLLAETMLRRDRPADAEPFLDAAIQRSRSTGERWSRTELLAFKAEVRAKLGDLDGAEALLAESRETLRANDYAAVGVYGYTLGFLRNLQGRYDEAEASYRHALDVILKSDNWFWQLAALDLADFLVKRGRPEEAAPLVDKVAEAVAGTELMLDRPRLERLQAQLGPRSKVRAN
jgi:ATP/maltotriose-dependent transcriptional regulator MalT